MHHIKNLKIAMLLSLGLSFPALSFALPDQTQFDQVMQNLQTAPVSARAGYVEQIKQWAKAGHVPSQVNLGQMYLQGDFVSQNLPEAFAWTSKAALKNNPKAQNNLGKMYLRGTGVQKDTLKAYELFGNASLAGLSDAQYNLGLMYEQGIGVEMSMPRAFGNYLKAVKAEAPQMLKNNLIRAKQGNAIAQNNLGYMYAIGFAAEKDSQQALYWFEQAAKQKLPEAMNNLGVLYDGAGEFVPKNFDPGYYKAIQHFQSSLTGSSAFESSASRVPLNRDLANQYFNQALKMKLAAAQCNMAKKYENGLGVNTNKAQAIQLYKAAVAQGYTSAEFELGRLYAAQQDADSIAKAIPLFESAALKGDGRAMNYSVILTGKAMDIPGWFNPPAPNAREDYQRWLDKQDRVPLTKEDFTAAGIQKLTQQAEQGNASSQYKLALFRIEGVEHLPKDLAKAEVLLKSAAAKGYPLANYELGKLYSREMLPAPKDKNDRSLFAAHKYAISYFEAAAAKGLPEAQDELGMTYELAMGVDENPAKAIAYYRQAAASGYPRSVRWINGFKEADRK